MEPNTEPVEPVEIEEEQELCSNCNEAINDCDCRTCDACCELCDDVCSRCDCCEGCCECVYCDNCDCYRDPERICSGCNYCNRCCSCNEAQVEFISRNLKFHQGKPTSSNPSGRFISMEIEVSSIDSPGMEINRVCRTWSDSVVEDGSLPDSGFEINSSPSSGDLFEKHIDELGQALRHHGASVTRKCGLHVHVDARDFSYWDIRRLCLLYSKIEQGLFECVSQSRRYNQYCLACGSSYLRMMDNPRQLKEQFSRVIYGVRDKKVIRDNKDNKYASGRYNALNIHSWVHRGTIECRMHQGSVDASKIKNWGILWAGILDFTNKNSERQIKNLKGTSFDILLEVAPTDAIRTYLRERQEQFS